MKFSSALVAASVAVASGLLATASYATSIAVTDFDFQTSQQVSGLYDKPTDSGWTLSPGLAYIGSIAGTHAGMLQASGATLGGTLGQPLTGLQAEESTTFDFDVRSRLDGGVGPAQLNVSIGGVLLQTVSVPNAASSAFQHVTFSTLLAPGGNQMLQFQGISPDSQDRSTYFDNVVITQTALPEPASLGLCGIGAIGLLARRRRA